MADPHSPDPHTVGKRYGKWMMALAWVTLAGLLTLYFDARLARQYNPNNTLQPALNNTIALKQNRQGHYVTSGLINQQPVVLLLDTGATEISIPTSVAERLGLSAGQSFPVNTANGRIMVRKTQLESLSIGGLTMYDLSANINPGLGGETILLGMNALKDLELIQRGYTLTLRKY